MAYSLKLSFVPLHKAFSSNVNIHPKVLKRMIKIICVCGARPNFIKIASLMRSFKKKDIFDILLVHTGQHYDKNMSHRFFDELDIPVPDINLEVGSGSHAVQTAKIMTGFEPVLLDFKPEYVLVVGDVNSTVACGLVAVKLGVKLIHVEAGLRSFDRTMPEEINRILTDRMSDLLFVSEQSGIDNLRHEGIEDSKIHFVGNVMIDTLVANIEKAKQSNVLDRLELAPQSYIVVTLHRPGNVDNVKRFENIVKAFEIISQDTKIVFPVHPRTLKNMKNCEFSERIESLENLLLIDPVGYLDFLNLMNNAAVVLTDSGGIQEETTILGVPCLTLRDNTERPVTVTHGTNRLIPVSAKEIVEGFQRAVKERAMKKPVPPKFWDGKAADRIVSVLNRIKQ